MNRLRLWLYVALLLLAGVANLYFVSEWLGARSLAQVDRDLRAASLQLDARTRLLAADAGDLADAASRAPAVVAGLAEASIDPLVAAEEALRPAAEAMRLDPKNALVAVSGTRGVQARAGAEAVALDAGAQFLADPARGLRREAHARVGEALFVVAGVPAGRGGAVAVGLPVAQGFAVGLAAATGVEVTVVGEGGKVVASTLPKEAAPALAALAKLPSRRAADVGALGAVQGALPLPALPLLFASAPEHRAVPIALEGVPGAAVVLSVAVAPHLAGLATYQAAALLALALFLLLGIVLGLLMTEEAGGRAVPRELLVAADRVSRGDFSARAPRLAGTSGILASALNRAAEAAEARAAEPLAAPATTGTQPIFPEPAPAAEPLAGDLEPADHAHAEPFAAEPEPAGGPYAEELPGEPEPTPAPPPPEAPAPAAFSAAAVEAAPMEVPGAPAAHEEPLARAARPAADEEDPSAVPELPPPPPAEPEERAEPTFAAAPTAVPPVEEDEAHWRTVFDEFLRIRGQTGEVGGAVAYDRFRTKLQKNRDQLVEKFGCRTVRFQVYVKEGKAAVRATPVR